MTKCIFIVSFDKGLKHLFECVAERLCACWSVSVGTQADAVLNANLWSALLALGAPAEVPFGCDFDQECCHHPHLWTPVNIPLSPAPTPSSLHLTTAVVQLGPLQANL